MKLAQVSNGHVLVLIDKEDKRRIFEKDIEQLDGTIVTFVKALEAGAEEDAHFGQSVQVGTIAGIAEDITWLVPGDLVILDYIADAEDEKIAYFENGNKVIILQALTTFHQDSKITYASMRNRQDTYTWKKGDVDYLSLIYAKLSNGILVPNEHYILLEHQDLQWQTESKSGIVYWENEGETVLRKVISVSENSRFKVGDQVVVERHNLYERSVENKNFDVVMERDILGTMKVPGKNKKAAK